MSADLAGLVHEAANRARASALFKGIEVSVTAAGRAIALRLDEDEILRALGSVLFDAARHLPVGDGRIEAKVYDIGREMVVEVADNRLDFCLVRRLDSAGSPLDREFVAPGLEDVRIVAKRHGGRFWVDVRSAGARCYLTLPAAGPAEGSRTEAVPPAGSFHPSWLGRLAGFLILYTCVAWSLSLLHVLDRLWR